MLAILVIGGLTFVATGVTPVATVAQNQDRLRTWGAALVVAAAGIVGALLLNGAELATHALAQDNLERVTTEWVDPYPNHDLVGVSFADGVVTATIGGPTDGRPPSRSLAAALAGC